MYYPIKKSSLTLLLIPLLLSVSCQENAPIVIKKEQEAQNASSSTQNPSPSYRPLNPVRPIDPISPIATDETLTEETAEQIETPDSSLPAVDASVEENIEENIEGGVDLPEGSLETPAIEATPEIPATPTPVVETPPVARSYGIKKIVVFGDSLSDSENFYHSTGNQLPLKPYWKGRFSNGPVWIEYVQQYLHIPVENRSIAGSRTSNKVNTFSDSFYEEAHGFFKGYAADNLLEVIDSYTTKATSQGNQEDYSKNLYVFFVGGNNFLDYGMYNHNSDSLQTTLMANWTLSDLKEAMLSVAAIGGEHFIVINLPEYIPSFSRENAASSFFESMKTFNRLLPDKIKEIKEVYATSTPPKTLNITLFDMATPYADIVRFPKNYQFNEDTENPCFKAYGELGILGGEVCNNPNRYLSFDKIHPSSRVHCLLARPFLKTLFSTAWNAQLDYDQFCQSTYDTFTKG